MKHNHISAPDTRPIDNTRSRYDDKEIHCFKDYLLKHIFTRDSPMKDDEKIKQGLDKKWEYDPGTNKSVIIPKKLICATPGEVLN